MTENQFEILIQINDETELYNSFDPNRKTISADLDEYIISCLKERNRGEKTLLHIVSDKEIDEMQFRKALDAYSDKKMSELEKSKTANRFNAFRMFGIGVIFILIGIFLNGKIGDVPTTVIETLGSFSIWEAANIWLEELPKLRFQQRIVKYLSTPEIVIEVRNAE